MPLTFQHTTLDNGLTVLTERNPHAHTAAMGYVVKTGSRDEPSQWMGVSHFLEHMMFKGTDRRSADDVNRDFDRIGANYNAFTSQEVTFYFAQILPEFVSQALDLLTDIMRPALRDDDFEMEKKVILEEIGMYNDRPQWRLHDALFETHFASHPLSHRVLGTEQSVTDLTPDQMRDYFTRRYSPDNLILVAAGQIDVDAMLTDLVRLAGHWPAAGAVRDLTPPQVAPSRNAIVDPKLNRHYFAAMSAAPSAQDPRRYAAKVLADVLGDSEGSRLYWALVDPGLADEADLTYYPQDHTGGLLAYASCDPDRASQVESILLQTLDDFTDSLQDDEVQRAKNKLATHTTLPSESPLGRMRDVGGAWLYLNQYIPLEQDIQNLMAVTTDDLRHLVRDFPFTPRTLLTLGPR